MDKMDNKIYNSIFRAVVDATLGEGGDGWGFIVSKNYKKMANIFETWEILNDNYFLIRKDYDDQALFYNEENGQEAIIFTDKKENVQFPDIVIEY